MCQSVGRVVAIPTGQSVGYHTDTCRREEPRDRPPTPASTGAAASHARSASTRGRSCFPRPLTCSPRGFHDASIDEIAERAGYSKGAVYWHFASKDDLFLALVEERVDRPTREMIELLQSAPAELDMVPEASRRFATLLAGQRDWLLLDNEYWSQAVRDPDLRRSYAKRRRELRAALGRALTAR